MDAMKKAFEAANFTALDLAWYERRTGKKYAPAPPCLLRHLAQKAGFLSTVEWLAAEHQARISRQKRAER
jgi:hypothetical protein